MTEEPRRKWWSHKEGRESQETFNFMIELLIQPLAASASGDLQRLSLLKWSCRLIHQSGTFTLLLWYIAAPGPVFSFSVKANQTKHNHPVVAFLWLHSIRSVPTSSSASCALCQWDVFVRTVGPDLRLRPEKPLCLRFPQNQIRTSHKGPRCYLWEVFLGVGPELGNQRTNWISIWICEVWTASCERSQSRSLSPVLGDTLRWVAV